MKNTLFCEINPLCYMLSEKKEIIYRYVKNLVGKEIMVHERSTERLPYLYYETSSHIIKKGKGVNPEFQYNKAINIKIACSKMNGIIINPGETFSFWKLVGKTSKKNGFKVGRILKNNKLISGFGGGLCNLANTIHLLVIHSPLQVTELHFHSDALAPDPNGDRVPLSAGTSVSYNYIDFRFKNATDKPMQLLLWCDEENLYGEIRGVVELPYIYEIEEKNHHFRKEGEKYYRVSQIYKVTKDKNTEKVIEKKLIRDNHSEVLFDYSELPPTTIL